MTRQQTIDLLELYPRIGQEISIYSNILMKCQDDWGLSSSGNLDGLPHGTDISNPTESLACKMALTGAGDYMREIEAQITQLQTLQTEIFREFKKLPYYQKMMVYYYYLDGKRWVWIANKLSYSERQCRNVRNQAVDALCTAFEANPNITPINENYRYTGEL